MIPFKHYAKTPNCNDQEFVRYVIKKEKEFGNKIGWKEALALAKQIERVSKENQRKYKLAEKEESISDWELDRLWKTVFVIRDKRTGLIHGRTVQPKRASLGMEVDSSTLRGRYQDGPAAKRPVFLQAIKEQEVAAGHQCDDERAETILTNGLHDGWIKFSQETKTYRGSRIEEPDIEDVPIEERGLTIKQQEWLAFFGDMPWLTFTGYKDPYSCEVIQWMMARAAALGQTLDPETAATKYQRSWMCSKNRSRLPLVRDVKTKKVCGRNFFLAEEAKLVAAAEVQKKIQVSETHDATLIKAEVTEVLLPLPESPDTTEETETEAEEFARYQREYRSTLES